MSIALSPADDFVAALETALGNASFVKLALRNYRGAEPALKSIDAKQIVVKRQVKLSFTAHYETRDIIKNYDLPEAVDRVRAALSEGFGKATLFTTAADWALDIGGARPRLTRAAPSQRDAAPLTHDRAKNRPIAAGKAYLNALGITDAQGQVIKSAQDKYRQINRYVEILSPLLQALPAQRDARIVDMGSGKGYLTFALYDYLTNILGRPASITGVEFRPDLVALCNKIATTSGFSGLDFAEGSIADYDSTGANVLIALHACDTATDDAIHKGIVADADLIVVAPCCHKQIRRQIEAHKVGNALDFLSRYGIFLEREAEMVTDGLRALILEYCGYSTKVFEFISDSHTPKNVLIVGTRNRRGRVNDPAVLQQIKDAKAYFGIEYHHLERALGI